MLLAEIHRVPVGPSGLENAGLYAGRCATSPAPGEVHAEEDDRPAQELARPEALNSSLSYLERFPVDYVKIDGSFVGKLGEESGAAVLTRGVIDLAHALGLKVIAEGVETEGQLEELRELGCDLAQGHYFSEPLTGEAAGALLEARILR